MPRASSRPTARFIGRQGAVVRLALDPRNQLVRTAAQEEKLAQALSRYFGETVRLEFAGGDAGRRDAGASAASARSDSELAAGARRPSRTDPAVQGLRERFGATLLPDSVRPVK